MGNYLVMSRAARLVVDERRVLFSRVFYIFGEFLGHVRVRSDGASAAGEAGSGAAAWGVEPASRASRPSPRRERCRARQTRKGSPARRQEQEDAAVGGDDGGRTEERLHAHARFEAARLGVVRAAVGSEPVHAVVGQPREGVTVARAHRCGTTNRDARAKARARSLPFPSAPSSIASRRARFGRCLTASSTSGTW